jgi:large subunit ribosomal protein L9
MEVVLVKDQENIGKALDVITVKDGFARNFLIPKGIAVPATEGNKKRVTETRERTKVREEKKMAEAREIAVKIEQTPCTIAVKVGEEEKIYGSVSSQEIADFLKKEGFTIEKRDVNLDEPIKQLGVYTVSITVFKTVLANLKVWVVKEE